MQKPFALTDEMKLELAGLGDMINGPDATRESPRDPILPRRTTHHLDRSSIAAGQGHDSPSDLAGEMEPQNDLVNHPSHYTSHPSGVECIAIVEWLPFNVGNAIKYMWRSGLKDSAPTVRDMKKAQWYINREIDRLKRLGYVDE